MPLIERMESREIGRCAAYATPIKRRLAAGGREVILKLALPTTNRPGETIWPAGLCQLYFRRKPFIHLGPEPLRGPIARNHWIGLGPGGLIVKNQYAPLDIEPLAREVFEAHQAGAAVIQAFDITIEEALIAGRPGFAEAAARLLAPNKAGLAPTRLITRWTLHGWAEILPAGPAAAQMKES